MSTPDAVEVTQQTQPVQHDSDYIKLRLDTQKLHQDILNFLQGTRIILKYDKDSGTYSEETISSGDPLANPQGIQGLLSFVVAIVNPHTIQGNTDKPELMNILKHMELGLAERLTLSYEAWGIQPENRDHIIDTIMFMVQMVLSRTIDNKERDSYNTGFGKISQIFQGKNTKKLI